MTPDFPSSETLQAEAASLTLPRFAEAEALALGRILTDLGAGLTIVINIRTPDRTLFHAALPGSGPINDRWIQRKSATASLACRSRTMPNRAARCRSGSRALAWWRW
jgi:uncharacterized protein (UPF0303 family)